MMLDTGAAMLQSQKPVKQMNQHVCTFAPYAHDLGRQIETHHFVACLNQDFLQCAVYGTDSASGRLIGMVYAVSLIMCSSLHEPVGLLFLTKKKKKPVGLLTEFN